MNDDSTRLRLAVLGAGRIGRPVGRHWLAAGHCVWFGSRDPAALGPQIEPFGGDAHVGTLSQAAENCDVALLSVPGPAVDQTLDELGDRLDGLVVVDATNPVDLVDGRFVSTLPVGLTEGRSLANRLPNSRVVRAFTHVMDELLWSRGTEQRGLWGMAVAGDDPSAKGLADRLVIDAGFVPVDLGGLDDSVPLDPGGVLFPNMFTAAEMHRALGVAAV